jgi:hypothetical protein
LPYGFPGNDVTPSDFCCCRAHNGARRLSATERRAAAALGDVGSEDPVISKRALARFLATKDTGVIDEAYDTFHGIFPKVPYFTEDNIRAVRRADHPKAAGADPKDFFDNRFVKELEDSGFVKELYGQK